MSTTTEINIIKPQSGVVRFYATDGVMILWEPKLWICSDW